MTEPRRFQCRLPDGQIRRRTRRRDQPVPTFAVVASAPGGKWGLYRMTASEDEVIRCVKELFRRGQSAYIAEPELCRG